MSSTFTKCIGQDFETPIAETARTLEDLRRQGKIRAIGVSNFSPTQMRGFSADAQLDAVQPPYNLFEREIEGDVMSYAAGAELTILSYGALCRGLLSGRMTAITKFDGDDLRNVDPKFQGKRYPQYLAAVEELKKLAHERFGKSVLALAVRWVLDQGPTIALWGARNPSQLNPIGDVEGWHIDPATKVENRCHPLNAALSIQYRRPLCAPPVNSDPRSRRRRVIASSVGRLSDN